MLEEEAEDGKEGLVEAGGATSAANKTMVLLLSLALAAVERESMMLSLIDLELDTNVERLLEGKDVNQIEENVKKGEEEESQKSGA